MGSVAKEIKRRTRRNFSRWGHGVLLRTSFQKDRTTRRFHQISAAFRQLLWASRQRGVSSEQHPAGRNSTNILSHKAYGISESSGFCPSVLTRSGSTERKNLPSLAEKLGSASWGVGGGRAGGEAACVGVAQEGCGLAVCGRLVGRTSGEPEGAGLY